MPSHPNAVLLNEKPDSCFGIQTVDTTIGTPPQFKYFFGSLSAVRDVILLSTTNKIQRYTTFFITVNAPHVSGCFSAHHQELNNCTHSIWCMSSLLAVTASGSSKKLDIYPMLCVQFLSS
jgi:hypothetical protein